MGSAGLRQSDKYNREGGSTLASGTGSHERVRFIFVYDDAMMFLQSLLHVNYGLYSFF